MMPHVLKTSRKYCPDSKLETGGCCLLLPFSRSWEVGGILMMAIFDGGEYTFKGPRTQIMGL